MFTLISTNKTSDTQSGSVLTTTIFHRMCMRIVIKEHSLNATTIGILPITPHLYSIHPYFGTNCSYAFHTTSLCTESPHFKRNISVSVAFDSTTTINTSDLYLINGCYDGQPHFINMNRKHYLYYSHDTNSYYISDHLGSFNTTPSAQCGLTTSSIYEDDVTSYTLSNCSFFQTNIHYSVALSFALFDHSNMVLFCGLPIASVCAIFLFYAMVKYDQVRANQSTETNKNIKDRTDTMASNKCDWKFIGKCVFAFVIKPTIEIYDYYTDIIVGISWLNLYGLRDGTKCRLDHTVYAFVLFICSSCGFIVGFSGHIYYVYQAYFSNKRLSYQSLSDLHQGRINYFVYFKMLVEDVVAIVLFLSVVKNEVTVVDQSLWFAYYSSCLSYGVSVIKLL
eukprot:280170_1